MVVYEKFHVVKKEYGVNYMKKIVTALLIFSMLCCFGGCSRTCKVCSQTETIDCAHCTDGGSGKNCDKCDGRAYFECATCSGEGYISTGSECWDCKGSEKPGYVCNATMVANDFYNGTLKDVNDDKYWSICGNCHDECKECSGSGNAEKCPDCTESGKVICEYCNGKQSVPCPDCNE